MSIEIRVPKDPKEWGLYYDLRWRLLRAPWQRPRGSEKDEIESECTHAALFFDGVLAAVSRLQKNSDSEGQIRYMAVDNTFQGQKLGKRILAYLEEQAQDQGMTSIVLDARENALAFYEACGYEVFEESYLLYGVIPHFKMRKTL